MRGEVSELIFLKVSDEVSELTFLIVSDEVRKLTKNVSGQWSASQQVSTFVSKYIKMNSD